MGQVEWESLKWVGWYDKTRPHSAVGYVTPNKSRAGLLRKPERGRKGKINGHGTQARLCSYSFIDIAYIKALLCLSPVCVKICILTVE
ncbi:MAG: hypothetical protein ACK5II_01175 [Paracoccus sp. (in: a-proteobacteria)]